jgi:hypothetical protein
MSALTFLSTLFEYKPEGTYVLIWTLQDEQSYWTPDLEDAARYAEGRGGEVDVYFGVGLASRAYESNQRLKQGIREPAGIYGVWADIDIAAPYRKLTRKVYPPTVEDALSLVGDTGLLPSCVVNSGGGLHCHWVFKEPWIFDTEAECQQARTLLWQWKETLKGRAAARGWQVDSVSDLERILRVPGTWNHKAARPVELWQKP